MECTVCGNIENILDSKHTHCPTDHKVCKDCYYQILKICYRKNKTGEPMYSCPICRNVHRYTNKEMYKVFSELRHDTGPQVAYFYLNGDNNTLKKCIFYDCGCRDNVVDLKLETEIKLDDLIVIANKY